MKKVSILIPHFKTVEWTAICVNAFKTYGMPVPIEIIVCDNSPGHPSIRAITETSLGAGVRVVSGNPDFPSHGMGYDIAVRHATGDWIFTSETDSFPTRHGWFDEYVKASADYALIGPSVPQSSGRYIHPAGAMVSRKILDAAAEWRKNHTEWKFVPSAAIQIGLSDRAYHVVCRERMVPEHLLAEAKLWASAGAWQEMRSFDEDSFETYSQRLGIEHFEPNGKDAYLKIGYEAGQWLHYFARHNGFRCMEASSQIHWMPGHERKQAAFSTVFDGFKHVWCGTMSHVSDGIAADVRACKMSVMQQEYEKLAPDLRDDIANAI